MPRRGPERGSVAGSNGASDGHTNDGERLAQRRWMVLLEAVPSAGTSLIDCDTADALLSALGDEHVGGLHRPDRVAVQVSMLAADVAAALTAVLARWRRAAADVRLHDWDVVRAEVLTPEEFERDSHMP